MRIQLRKAVAAFTLPMALVLFGQAPEAQASTPLSASEIRSIFPGTFEGVWGGNHSFQAGIDRDGTLRGHSSGRFDQGRWFIDGNELCIAWDVWTRGNARCGKIYKRGSWYEGMIRNNGEPRLRFRKM